MAFEFCGKHGEDTAMYCFVNGNGEHVPPRKCECIGFAPVREVRLLKDWPTLQEKYIGPLKLGADAMAKYLVTHVITAADYKALMRSAHGKENPSCPIEDEHDPISPTWRE